MPNCIVKINSHEKITHHESTDWQRSKCVVHMCQETSDRQTVNFTAELHSGFINKGKNTYVNPKDFIQLIFRENKYHHYNFYLM